MNMNMKLFSLERLYKFNMVMIVLNLIFAVTVAVLGLPSPFAHLFLASGICFFVGAIANYAVIKMHKHSKK